MECEIFRILSITYEGFFNLQDCTLGNNFPSALIPVHAADIEEKSGSERKPSNVFVGLTIVSNFSSILDEMGKINYFILLICSRLTKETLEQGVKYDQS